MIFFKFLHNFPHKKSLDLFQEFFFIDGDFLTEWSFKKTENYSLRIIFSFCFWSFFLDCFFFAGSSSAGFDGKISSFSVNVSSTWHGDDM